MRHLVLTFLMAGLAVHAASSSSTKGNGHSQKADGIPVASEANAKTVAFPSGTVYFTKKTGISYK